MSFFKKLKEEFGGSQSSEQQSYPPQNQGYPQQHGQYPPQDQYNRPPPPSQHSSYGQPAYGQPAYGQPPQHQGSPAPYGSRDVYGGQQQHQPYGQPPPPSQYGGSPAPSYGPRPGDYNSSPAPYGAPPPPQQQPDGPPVPGQYVPLFSEQHQRWYFVETTGRSLWDAPGYVAPQAPMPAYGDYQGSRGVGGASGGYGAPPGPPGGDQYRSDSGYGQGGYGEQKKPEKDNDTRNMMLAAGGALAVGAIGGAVVADALDDSDDEHRAAAPAPVPELQPTPMPALDAYGNPIDEDDRDSIRSAREEYQEAVADSDASSSDVEEAREEYQEEVDEAYYDED